MKLLIFCITFIFLQLLMLTSFAQNKVEVDIKTGADNLEPKDFMDNPCIVLRIRNKADVVVGNINKGQTWANNSLHRITIPIADDVVFTDINEITIIRKDKDGSKNNLEATVADNWNIDKLLVTATFKKDGRTIKYQLLNKEGNPLIRFVYELRGAHNANETASSKSYLIIDTKIISGAPAPTPSNPNLVSAKPVKIEIEITTGDDDLRGGGDNLTFKIFLKNKPNPIYWRNVNANRPWQNNSVKLKEKTFNEILNFDDIIKIEMWHDGGGGIGADNWNVDKVSVIAKQDTRQKILVNAIGAPMHRFTGDTRKKVFVVE